MDNKSNKEKVEKAGAVLEDCVERYDSLKESYNDFIERGDTGNAEALLQYELRFNNLLSDFIPVSSRVIYYRQYYNEKRASALKSRVEVDLLDQGEKSQARAKAYAAASKEYRDFLDDGLFWYESSYTIEEMINSIKGYINNCIHYYKIANNKPAASS